MSTRSVRWDFQLPRVWSINARERGWLVPAYTLPEGQSERAVLRFVVRAGFSRHLAEELLEDMARAVAWFGSLESAMPVGHPEPTLFHH